MGLSPLAIRSGQKVKSSRQIGVSYPLAGEKWILLRIEEPAIVSRDINSSRE